MFRFASLCLIVCIGARVAGAAGEGYEYVREADAWLRLHVVPASWSDAGMRCYLEGGVLASPTSSAMVQVMTAMIAREQQMTPMVFTGINSILSRDNFKSLEGVPLARIPARWAAGEPDNAEGEEACVALTGAGALANVRCDSPLPYFCRKEAANKCGPVDNGYAWEPRTGSCYKFHRAGKTWLPALAACHAEGGHLAIINSDTEHLVLKEIFARNPVSTITTAFYADTASIGFRKWDDGKWGTIFGETLSKAGFDEWSSGEPNNFSGWDENCGAIKRDGLLNDIPCKGQYGAYPFICEITP